MSDGVYPGRVFRKSDVFLLPEKPGERNTAHPETWLQLYGQSFIRAISAIEEALPGMSNKLKVKI